MTSFFDTDELDADLRRTMTHRSMARGACRD
jgi:hypothetical protein